MKIIKQGIARKREFFKAGVIDIELVTDHAIFANLINTAKKKSIKYILSGTNIFTEHAMPPEWMWRKTDFKNIKSIHYNFSDKFNEIIDKYK